MEKDLLNIERVKGVLYTMPMVKKRILQKKLRKCIKKCGFPLSFFVLLH